MAYIIDAIEQFSENFKDIGFNLLLALIIIVIGVLIGKFVKLILSRSAKKLKLDTIFKYGAVEVFLTIVKWAIYLFFIGFAIKQLNLPYFCFFFFCGIFLITKIIYTFFIFIIIIYL